MLYDSSLWIEDLDTVLETLPELKELSGKKVLITGASGLICSAVADLLIRYNEKILENAEMDALITIYAAGRSPERMWKRFGEYLDRDYMEYVFYDASKPDQEITVCADYIIHGASNAYPKMIVKEPVETMADNFLGMYHLLSYARDKGVRRVLFVSSSEVYGKKEGTKPYREDEYGYIDLLNARNSYSIGKQAAETLCASFAAEYGVESVIIRPGHIYGPTASRSDNRVSSAWAYDVAEGKDIVMKSDGAQIRSYCYCLDAGSAILKAMLLGESVKAYNISNPQSIINIRQMAQILADSAGVELRMELPSEEERKGFNPMSNSSLEGKSLIGLGWKGCFSAEKGLAHTVKIIQESGA